jgi:hypothetical protein
MGTEPAWRNLLKFRVDFCCLFTHDRLPSTWALDGSAKGWIPRHVPDGEGEGRGAWRARVY